MQYYDRIFTKFLSLCNITIKIPESLWIKKFTKYYNRSFLKVYVIQNLRNIIVKIFRRFINFLVYVILRLKSSVYLRNF